ncbi:MAG TPA: hypothetical protein DCE41_17660, partial [Cytophagales bacterium]|nr:hypothetical protein [Cytophagales bacterium]
LTDAVQIGSEISATVTIEDNDKETTEAELPSVTVSASAASAAEDGTNGEFTFTLDSANTTGEAISIPYTVSGTATSDTDYTALSGSVDIASGETTATEEVTVTDDTSEEEDETVIVTVDTANLPSTVTAGTTLEATVTITDNDFETTVQLAATDNTASEDGDNGEFTITLAKANDTGSDISILYTIGGTATNGTDYSTLSGTVDIADGQTSATIAVTITDDSDDEDDEYVSLTIDTGDLPTGISAGTTISDTLTIADNDFVTTAEIEVTDSTATEDGNNAEFTITLAKTNDTGATISIPYTVGGTATDGTDYTSLSGSVDIADGASSATIAVTITDDSDDDDDETVTLTLDTDNFPTGITGGTSTSASVTITDNDFVTTVTITAQDDTGTEGSDDGQFVVALGKSNDTGSSLTIPYTVSGTATEGTDYASLSGSVTIDDGQTQATILIDVTDDSDAESNETVTLTLDDGNYPTGISSGTSTEATVNIIDDDVASPTITFGTATGNSITIDSWTDVGADGYVIYISRANNISDLTDGDDPVESTTYGHNAGQPIYDGTSISSLTVTLLEESKTYYFRVFPYTGSRDYDVSYGAQSTATTTCETTSTTDSQVCWSRSAGTLTVTSNQLPGLRTGSFPNADVTAIEITADMDATPSQASDTTYVYQEDGGATPSNAFYRFGFASNGLGYNPMGLKPWTNDTTGEENWEWQEQLTAPAAGNHIDDYGGHVTSAGKYHYHGDMVGLAPDEDGTRHSLLYGYAADGFPIYYKYSYSNPTDPTSSIVELKSSYQLRS